MQRGKQKGSLTMSGSVQNYRNHILRSLPSAELARLASDLDPVELTHGAMLVDVGEPIEFIYFPEDSMISVVTSTISGQMAECGVIGWEALAGVEALMGDASSLNRQIVQRPGPAYYARIEAVKKEFARGGALQQLVLGFVRAMMAQVSQTTLCNRLHLAEKRLAKWLLLCRDRASSDVLPITQEFAALMLGANRVSVTQAAIELQDNKYIEYSRGRIKILDRLGLEAFSCECYARIRNEYRRFTGETSHGRSGSNSLQSRR
jgi:CRP-like cAMP-binding protein